MIMGKKKHRWLFTSKTKSTKKQKPGIAKHQNKGCVFPEPLAWAAPERHLVALSVGERQVGRSWGGGRWVACLRPVFLSCFRSRSDVMAVVEVGRVQAVIMPLPPLLHCLPGPLLLL